MVGSIDAWMDGWTSGWMDEWMGGQPDKKEIFVGFSEHALQDPL